jgi:hypothetical protein
MSARSCLAYARCDKLSLELVGQDEVCLAKQPLVFWYFVFWDVELAVVTHDWVKHYPVSALPPARRVCPHIPQKKLPGFVPALNLTSLPIFPIACTASALGMYPVKSTSKLVRFDWRNPSYRVKISSADVFVPLTCLYAV